MSVKAVLVVAALIVAGGGAATTGGVADVGATDAQPQERPSDVDAAATLTNGTVTLVVTDAGNASEGVNVSVDGDRVGATDANGTVTFAAGNASKLEVTLAAPGFEGELEYVVRNDTLGLASEEYEYAVSDADEDDSEADDDADDDEEAEADAEDDE